MSKVISITDKLSSEKPALEFNGKIYPVDDSIETVFKFEEKLGTGTKGMLEAIELTLGKQAVKELGVTKMSTENFKILVIAIMAAIQGITYEEADARFRKQEGN